jgi:hypothetical protein
VVYVITVVVISMSLSFLKHKTNIIASVPFMMMKLFLFVLVISLSFFVTLYSKHFFNVKTIEGVISFCSNSFPFTANVNDFYKYLSFLWLCLAIGLIPFHFIAQNPDGSVNENGSTILQRLYFVAYNLPVYILSLMLLGLFIHHMMNLLQDDNYCKPDLFFHDLKDLQKLPGFFFVSEAKAT